MLTIAHNPKRFAANVTKCHKCPSCEHELCVVDSVPVVAHADAGHCPRGEFDEIVLPPPGWETLREEPPPVTPATITGNTPAETVCGFLAGAIPAHIAQQWAAWPNVQEAHRLAMADAFKAFKLLPPAKLDGRGIVIVGGGKYFASVYVTVRMLRHVGCTLPVEVWYLGRNHELLPWQEKLLAPLGVKCIDADARPEAQGLRVLNGWELKPFAVLHSSFAEVLYLDADSYPVRNPESLFEHLLYQSHGAIFWPDPPMMNLLPEVWRAMGMEFRDEQTFESGQFIVDKRRHELPLRLTHWMNQHSDFYYKLGPRSPVEKEGQLGQGIYGDKDTWHLAWRYAGHEYVMPDKDYAWVPPAMIQNGFDGRPLFVHRARRKFTLDEADKHHFGTSPQEGPTIENKLPMEREAHGFFAELKAAVPPVTDHDDAFASIYHHRLWGGGSGHGSRETTTAPYRALLQSLIDSGNVKRVVDLGCGDWEFTRLIDWKTVDYLGVDVVPSVVEINARHFARPNVRFECKDVRTYQPSPLTDLIILKDVLQHWPNADVFSFLDRFKAFPMLITNTVRMGSVASVNSNIPIGGFRPLDLRACPFSLAVCAETLMEYQGAPGDYKAVLLLPGDPDANRPSRGLGDTIARWAKATGADKLAGVYTRVTGKPCGCIKRERALNDLVAFEAPIAEPGHANPTS